MEDQEEDFYSNFESFLQNPLGLTKLQIEEKNNETKNEDLTAKTIKPKILTPFLKKILRHKITQHLYSTHNLIIFKQNMNKDVYWDTF